MALTLLIAGALTSYTLNWVRPQAQPAPSSPGTQRPAPPPPPRAEVDFGQQPIPARMEAGVPTYDLVLKKVMWDSGGETFTYEYKPGPPGTHMYHSHFNGAVQTAMGLFGPLIVEPRDPNHATHPSKYDREHILILGDSGLGLTMSGKGFPYNQPIKVKTGERVLHRLINTLDIAPGQTYDTWFEAKNPGSWLYHCHILPHAEGPDGMFGLTALVEYEGYEPDPNSPHAHQAPTARRLPGTPGKHQH